LNALEEVDRYALDRYAEAALTVVGAYERYDFPTIFQTITQFTTVDLSAFYADVSKDRLYTFGAGSAERRSAQTAMHTIADGLVRLLAPILPVTADELWRHLPGQGQRHPSVHIAEFPTVGELTALRDEGLRLRWDVLLEARSAVNASLEARREQKQIGSSLQARVTIDSSDRGAASLLKRYRDALPMLFIVSDVALGPIAAAAPDLSDAELSALLAAGTREWTVDASAADGHKCARCWRVVQAVSSAPDRLGLCDRCIDALAGGAAA
jgi:isoleucyl-tRNA synthetase